LKPDQLLVLLFPDGISQTAPVRHSVNVGVIDTSSAHRRPLFPLANSNLLSAPEGDEVGLSCADVVGGEPWMTDRAELLEAALDSLPEGIALAGLEGRVVFWNRAAEAITGHAGAELLGRPVRDTLDALIVGGAQQWSSQTDAEAQPGRGSLVHVNHRLGHDVAAMVRVLVLRDGLGERIGAAALFHPAERVDELPHGQCGKNEGVETSQAELEDRLEAEFDDFVRGRLPFGVLWITVDQAHELRKTHGARACEAMLERAVHALASKLRPGEELGRWGEDEFLVISHELTPEMLAAHAEVLAGLARTADFHWWGDRVSLTVSIGAAQADPAESLAQLLERAQEAMVSSIHAGGNHITSAPGGQPCLSS
jgi:diguanylate cyclase (GGDEF)-like protein/PAS domain S-box-containing protein